MREAAGDHPDLARRRGRAALGLVEAPDVATAPAGRARERSQPGVLAGAPVVEPRGGDVADPQPGAQQCALPALLVAAQQPRFVEAPDARDRGAADRHVRPPGMRHVAVLGPEVLLGDRRALAPARAQRVVLEDRADRTGEHADVVPARRVGGDQRVQPAGVGTHVVVDEAEQLARGVVEARVARGVQALRGGQRVEGRAVAARHRLGGGVGPVGDHEQADARPRGLRGDRGQRDVQVGRPRPRGDDDGGGRGHTVRCT
jgi:hypothetical protein